MNTAPRVLYLLRPSAGGMRRHVEALLAKFSDSRIAAPQNVLAEIKISAPRQYPIAESVRPGALLSAGVQLGRRARADQVTLLHGHGLRWAPLFWSAALISRLPLVITLHNLLPNPLPRRDRVALQLLLARAARVIAVSNAVADTARGMIRPDRLQVIRNGVDTDYFRPPTTDERLTARLAWQIAADTPLIVSVARLAPEKGMQTLIEGFALLVNDVPDACLLIAGDGPLHASLSAQIKSLRQPGRVRLIGETPSVLSLLHAADWYVQPSREEGLGIAALEAMATGLPVVATKVGGLPEVVAHGVTGVLIPPDDAAALAETLQSLLARPNGTLQLGAAARTRIVADFSLPAMLGQTGDVYESVAGRQQA